MQALAFSFRGNTNYSFIHSCRFVRRAETVMRISDTRALNVSRETYGLPILNEYNQRGVYFRSATRRKSRSPDRDIDNGQAAFPC